jgi:hypothetical protein
MDHIPLELNPKRAKEGVQILKILSDVGMPILAAAWIRASSRDGWRCSIVTPWVDHFGELTMGYLVPGWIYAHGGGSFATAAQAVRPNDKVGTVILRESRDEGNTERLSTRVLEWPDDFTSTGYFYSLGWLRTLRQETWKPYFPLARVWLRGVSSAFARHSDWADLVGTVNAEPFEGHGPQTMLFRGIEGHGLSQSPQMQFLHRPEGWNTAYHLPSATYLPVTQADGSPLYRAADFTPLAQAIAISAKQSPFLEASRKLLQTAGSVLTVADPTTGTVVWSSPTGPQLDWETLDTWVAQGGVLSVRLDPSESLLSGSAPP